MSQPPSTSPKDTHTAPQPALRCRTHSQLPRHLFFTHWPLRSSNSNHRNPRSLTPKPYPHQPIQMDPFDHRLFHLLFPPPGAGAGCGGGDPAPTCHCQQQWCLVTSSTHSSTLMLAQATHNAPKTPRPPSTTILHEYPSQTTSQVTEFPPRGFLNPLAAISRNLKRQFCDSTLGEAKLWTPLPFPLT